jgi:hypothetical protein
MSPELQEFYNSYQAWLERGAPDCAPYNRRYGLCYAIHTFVKNKWLSDFRMRTFLCEEMTAQFMRELAEHAYDAGYPELKGIYPFGLKTTYHAEEALKRAHLNVKRQAWVRKHATNVKEVTA